MIIDPALLWPMLALVALTFLVMVEMYRRRIAEIRSRRIPLASIATSRGMATLEDVAAADNFRNLFEMPVLFYAACLTLAVLGPGGRLPAMLAWCYVALRVLHSAIHLRSIRVRWRFNAFATSTAVLLALWMVAAVQIASRGYR